MTGLKQVAAARDLAGATVHCTCGRDHRVQTRVLHVGEDALDQAVALIGPLGKPLLVADENTWAASGQALADKLTAAGVAYNRVLLDPHGHADAAQLGRVIIAQQDAKVLVAVGTGTINDTTRYAAFKVGAPYLVVGTAPSMDGYASSVSPLLVDGFKITYEAVAPEAVLADTDALIHAPEKMIAAGYGDIMGKLTALADWRLAHVATGEYICPDTVDFVARTVALCRENCPEMAARKREGVGSLMEALALSGLAMQMIGNSRPASGAEHHISHLWEMRDNMAGRPAALHGDKVGVTTLLMIRMYEKFFGGQPPRVQPRPNQRRWLADVERVFGPTAPTVVAQAEANAYTDAQRADQRDRVAARWADFAALAASLAAQRQALTEEIAALGGPVHPRDFGYTRQDTYDALVYAKEVRPRYSLLRLMDAFGVLEDIAGEVADDVWQ